MFLDQILRAKCLNEETRQLLSLIVSQLNLLLCLVNDVLDFKMIKLNRYEPKLCIFDPNKTLNFIEQMFR